jgi:predicted ArsR family transcriptional regulator
MRIKKDHSARDRHSILEAPSATHERILRLLGMTQRPLRSGELENALGLFAGEARSACNWLTEKGYITSTVRMGRAAAHWARTFWSLADKGRSWARAQGALVT